MIYNVLVYVPDGLVEDDVVATVQEVLDRPKVRIVHDLEAACATLGVHKDWAWAVIQVPADQLQCEDLRQAFRQNKALPVVLSEQIDDPEISDWVFLEPPFDTEMLREALEKTRPF